MGYIIWCDESILNGKYFSNFYGGALINSIDLDNLNELLNDKKKELNFNGEVKWVKVTENYLEKYINLISLFFNLVSEGKIKVRIMFRQASHQAVNLNSEQKDNQFYLLYYQFVKHSFGFKLAPIHELPTSLVLNFDKLPDKKEKSDRFKEYIYKLNSTLNSKNIHLPRDNISEVNSHDHVVLQCMDIVLGAMAFRLNKMHLATHEATGKRGRKTKAKEELYKHIYAKISQIHPHFNIGMSTGKDKGGNAWDKPYSHWKFVPKNHVYIPAV